MNIPPYGYDDTTLIARQRMVHLMNHFGKELEVAQHIFRSEGVTQTDHLMQELEENFWHLRHNADALGSEYSRLVDTFIQEYKAFLTTPRQDHLTHLTQDVENLKHLLGS